MHRTAIMKDCVSPHLQCANKELILSCSDFSLDQKGERTEATEMCSPTLAQQRESGHWITTCGGFFFYKIYRIVFFSSFHYLNTNIEFTILFTDFSLEIWLDTQTLAMTKEGMIRFNC